MTAVSRPRRYVVRRAPWVGVRPAAPAQAEPVVGGTAIRAAECAPSLTSASSRRYDRVSMDRPEPTPEAFFFHHTASLRDDHARARRRPHRPNPPRLPSLAIRARAPSRSAQENSPGPPGLAAHRQPRKQWPPRVTRAQVPLPHRLVYPSWRSVSTTIAAHPATQSTMASRPEPPGPGPPAGDPSMGSPQESTVQNCATRPLF